MSTIEPSHTGPLAGDRRLYIDGQLVDAADKGLMEVIDPSTERPAGEAADATAEDMDRAVAAARRSFDEGVWARDPQLRHRCLMQLHEALAAERERLRRVVVTEAGSPIRLTDGVQLQQPIDEARYWAEMARDFPYEQEWSDHVSNGRPSGRRVHYEPVGVVGAITPWNYPLYLDVAESVPALAAGNSVVLKPAPDTPWSGLELGRIIAERTDIPPGVFNVVTTGSVAVSELLTTDPRVDMITFTGSTATGKRVLAASAATVKRCFMELGGKSAHIVLDDADLTKVLPRTSAVCSHSGQGCTLSTRLLVPRNRYDASLAILEQVFQRIPVGDAWDPATLHGPQINEAQMTKVLTMVEEGVASGARLVTGGKRIDRTGYYVEPTVLADVDPGSRIGQEEVFGPVLCVLPYDSEDEAVAIANGTPYGLAGEVSSGSDERALAVARRLRAGNVGVNGGGYFGVSTPLGGYGQSGNGRRNGEEGFREYMELKAIGMPKR
ncbi:aldehyde dehydrogenase family protein [Streptomyces sp. NPDC048106]|uniref:aldehyde dehydrogenase family protein n=1 Tax=Streptomyces sp. NPDC048106 TaxID=3155750 RepID=UPI0034523E6B